MLYMRVILLCLISVSLLSCNTRMHSTYRFAGNNKDELHSVIQHYTAEGDQQKLQAAKYLISNMPGHYSMTGDYQEYINELRTFLDTTDKVTKELKIALEEISTRYNARINYKPDVYEMTSDYLIRNIDTAFEHWRQNEWASYLTFDEFCEWLLPYTCSNYLPLYDWRASLKAYAESYIYHINQCNDYKNSPRIAICAVNDILRQDASQHNSSYIVSGHRIFDPSLFPLIPGTSCRHYAEMVTLILRSKGIPVSIDFTPQWPDRQFGHDWCVYPTFRGKKTIFNPYFSNPDFPHNTNARFAKVFRVTYAPNKEYLRLLKRNNGDVPKIVDSPFFTDVSEEYQKTIDLKVRTNKSFKLLPEDVYIAVFDNHDWVPVYWGKCFGKYSRFKEMGRNITYIVLSHKNRELVPISLPFKVNSDGSIHYFSPQDDYTDVVMRRKFPMFEHVFRKHEVLKGGYIEAANDIEFHNSEVVCEFPEWELSSAIVPVNQSIGYRYWRFCADQNDTSDVAELFFYKKEDNKPLERSDMELLTQRYESMTDRDPLTYSSTSSNNMSGCIDLGQAVYLDHISFIRRGDGNTIVPGDEYQLYYWDKDRWIFHSSIIAEDVEINVKNLPENALCLIKGVSRGTQNRIFSYNEQKEIVWH